MARKTETRREAPAGAPITALGKARWMMRLGDVRRARAFAEEAAGAGSSADQAEARGLLDRLRPDRDAMLAAGAVLVLITAAAWVAILHAH